MRSFSIRHGEMPRPTHESRVGAQHFDSQPGELQLAHFVPRTRVRCAVAVDRGLPSLALGGAGEKRQLRRIPVTGHEGLEIVAVPGVLLRAQYIFDGGLAGWGRISSFLDGKEKAASREQL